MANGRKKISDALYGNSFDVCWTFEIHQSFYGFIEPPFPNAIYACTSYNFAESLRVLRQCFRVYLNVKNAHVFLV